ncbi:hypothetical protein ACS0TY_014251 [Phlomoides rotata]
MQKNSPPPITPAYLPSDPEMASGAPHIASGDPTSSSLFDWSDFLDFNIDALDTSFLQSELGPGPEPEISHSQPSENVGRIRKRDPRLLCPNFAAGRIPCACPELDKQIEEQEEEEAAAPGKKRARTVRASSGAPLRCQVPGCEADISELKGYHKRHRVCLQCAHASSVMLDGEKKRYCQQCGKFHVLSNFDEGKRSCRMKLDIHNRRRKKSNDSKGGSGKEAQQAISSDDVKDDDDTEKDGSGTSPSSQSEERETLLESDGHVSTISSAPSSQNLQGESVVSFDAPREIQNNGQKQSPKNKHSASHPDNKSNFSSVCPSGRISFKLYDWNPAEFPRRLRLQIFEWLASMPIELEGYVRPGCTILTAFIAMPKPMWLKLKEKPAFYIKDLVASPGNMLFGRGTMLVYLNDLVFRVTRDSVIQVSVKDRSPKLHYIYPTCFEAGRPMEFVACGSNLLQSKFRFLVSFAGRYLAYNICVSSLCCKKGNSNNFDHQLVKISIPQTDINIFGPAFIEVENQSGLSNFIPILIGDKETCVEMEILQRKSGSSLSSQERQCSPPMPSCEVLAVRQKQFSGFILDVAWLLKKPVTDTQPLSSLHIQRFNYVLDFLIEKGSSVILERVFCSLKSAIGINFVVAGVSDSDMKSLREKMGIAQNMLSEKLREEISAVMPAFHGVQETNEFKDSSSDLHDTVSLINAGVVNIHNRPRKSCSLLLSRTFSTSRPLIMAIATVCVCFGVCVALFHPQKASEIATTIRRCLFDSS